MFNGTGHGLYSLGSVPDNGFMVSACAFGNIVAGDKGVVYIVIVNSDRKMRSFQKVEVSSLLCLTIFDNNNRPRKGDLITVYIPKNPHHNGYLDNTTNQPLQISFYNANNINKYQFLELSAISETNVNSLIQGINRALGLWNWKDLEDPTLDFNIQVRIVNTCT